MVQNEYRKGEPVELKVIKLDSVKTLLPYSYYTLPFCKPATGVKDMIDNLGEILVGDRIENSPFQINALENQKVRKVFEIGKFAEAGIRKDFFFWIASNFCLF